ncbi:MAG: ABC transporter substrate-binding protein, partial [Gammaproteobacteria bacterium]|nr:ABC transporter substrate-binding protein [Gammaproteobacteria bacterium]
MKAVILGLFCLWVITAQAAECPRIISQSPYITHSLQFLGLKRCIVGVSRYDDLDLPRTGGILDPDKQTIDGLMPDLIFTTNWISDEAMAKVTPKEARYFRLTGFNSLHEIEQNLRIIGRTTGDDNYDQKIATYKTELDRLRKQIDGKGKKALLLSSCSGSPYSFGKQTWLYDLFNQMNFKIVETHAKIRHIKAGQEITKINNLLNTFEPDILFIMERKLNSRCNLILPKVPVKIITLDGNHFLHPAPVLLEGLKELA